MARRPPNNLEGHRVDLDESDDRQVEDLRPVRQSTPAHSVANDSLEVISINSSEISAAREPSLSFLHLPALHDSVWDVYSGELGDDWQQAARDIGKCNTSVSTVTVTQPSSSEFSEHSSSIRESPWWPIGSIDSGRSVREASLESHSPERAATPDQPQPEEDPSMWQGGGCDRLATEPAITSVARIKPFDRLRIDSTSVQEWCQPSIASMFRGTSKYTYLRAHSARGKPKKYTAQSSQLIDQYVCELLKAGLIKKARRGSYIAHPCIIPKADGGSRLIIDYSHLRGHYDTPPLHLPAFAAIMRSINLTDQFFTKIDLRNAFYSVPLPETLKGPSAFRWGKETFQFEVLPMGMYASPAILQSIVTGIVRNETSQG